jgi:hypothetical protein
MLHCRGLFQYIFTALSYQFIMVLSRVITNINTPSVPCFSNSLYELSFFRSHRSILGNFLYTVELGYNVIKGTEYFVSL